MKSKEIIWHQNSGQELIVFNYLLIDFSMGLTE